MKGALLSALMLCLVQTAITQQSDTGKPKRLPLGVSAGIQLLDEAFLAKARANGIEYIETGLKVLLDSGYQFRYSDQEIREKLRQIRKAADAAGIKFWSVHMPFGPDIDLSLADEHRRQQVVAFHKRIIEYCSLLQPRIILFHPSYFLGLNEREVRKTQMIKSAVALNKKVKSIGATMVIENMFGPELLRDAARERPLFRTVEEAVEIMNRLPADIYSAIDMNHAKYPASMIYAMGDRLKTIHVADGTDKAENHYLPCSGKGHNDWVAILVALDAVGYQGPFMYESKYKDLSELKSCYEQLYQHFLKAREAGKKAAN
ncbi:hypothetical protein GCM10027051_15040 [Niabella terrae]